MTLAAVNSRIIIAKLGQKKLGELLLENGLISQAQLESALASQRTQGGKVGEILVRQGAIGYQELLAILRDKLKVPIIDVKAIMLSPYIVKLIPETFAREHAVIPVKAESNRLSVVMAYPDDIQTIRDIRTLTSMEVDIAIGAKPDIMQAIDLNYRSYEPLEKLIINIENLEERREESPASDERLAPASQVLSMIIERAIQERASDVHLKPQDGKMRVRFRIDGALYDRYSLPASLGCALTSRLKILAGMNIAEQRRPQDGHFSIKLESKRVDIRVASTSTSQGERVTLRILDKSMRMLTLDQLGFLPQTLETFETLLTSSHGMVLIGGPTGSGKTTTLYAALGHISSAGLNIMSIEDPIEYNLDDISQMQVNVKAGITFASGLRSLMRHDPDIILVGEIRDQETAAIAVQAALTWALVLASIHAHDTAGMLVRMVELGVERYLVASTVIGLVAQRMVRRICANCRTSTEPSAYEKEVFRSVWREELNTAFAGNGCAFCGGTGYHGRTGIFEILRVNDAIRSRVLGGADASGIKEAARQQGILSLEQAGLVKAKQGITTLSEVLRCATVF